MKEANKIQVPVFQGVSPSPIVLRSLKNEKSTPIVISFGVAEMFIVEPHETKPASEAVCQSLHCQDLINAGVLQLINS